MSSNKTDEELAAQPSGLVTIERAVAFVVGPAIVAGSAWLSAFLASKLGVEVSSSEITAVAATGGIGAAGLIYKWLDGRSKHTLQQAQIASEKAQGFITKEGVPLATQDGIIHIAEKDLRSFAEGIAEHAVNTATEVIKKATVPVTMSAPEQSEPDVPLVQDEPIVQSPVDPAPATPLEAEPPVPIQVPDTGGVPIDQTPPPPTQ